MLAAGLAVLAAALGSTLERSSRERSAYQTGSDIHVSSARATGLVSPATMSAIRAVDGVREVSLALRTSGDIGTTGRGEGFDLLAVESERLEEVLWFREDFADKPLGELLVKLPVQADPPPIDLPVGATHIEMWTRAQPRVSKLFLWVVLRNAQGGLHTITLGPIGGETWARQVAPLPDGPEEPFRLVSILTYEPVGGDAGSPSSVFFDDLAALDGEDGEATVLVDFERRDLWTPLPTSQGFDVGFDVVPENEAGAKSQVGAHPGGSVARLTIGRGTDSGVRGIYRTANASPIPIIASEDFLIRNGFNVGDRFVGGLSGSLTPMMIVDSVRLFPTMDPDDKGFAIVDLGTLQRYAELRGAASPGARMQEVFVATDPALHRPALERVRAAVGAGAEIIDRPGLESSYLIDPLTVAGWRGVGLVATVATLAVAGLGLLTYLGSYLSRTRVESGFLRALGLARSAQLGAMAIEQLSITLVGLLLGTVAGVAMTRVAVDSVSHTESGRPVLPPFVLSMEWLPVMLVFGGLALVAAAALGRMAIEYARLPLHMLTRRDE
ncbi:MAG: ABC transporter permease [Chloroflexi bacterium]|nr:ABC transporter permease [Chloroflexota bacterium]